MSSMPRIRSVFGFHLRFLVVKVISAQKSSSVTLGLDLDCNLLDKLDVSEMDALLERTLTAHIEYFNNL